MPEKKSLVPWIILIFIIVVGMGLFLFIRYKTPKEKVQTGTTTTQSTTQTPEETNLTNVTPEDYSDKLKENYNIATQKALEWHPDAVLVAVQVKLTSLTPDEGMETYVFDSPVAASVHYTITISQKSKRYIRASIPVEDYLGSGLLPIDPAYWKANYVSALQVAEQNSGKEFRDSNMDWSIELNLKRAEPNNYLYWIADYKTSTDNSLSVKINANTKEVVK